MSEPADTDLTFEQSLDELEKVVHDLEDGQLGLELSLTRYEHGVRLLQRCSTQLRQAEQRILELTGVDDAGQPALRPFAHEATAPAATPPKRARRAPADD